MKWVAWCDQKSLASYIKRHSCSNAKTEDLWAALEEGSGEPVNKLMSSWTKQQGYPVVTVKVTDEKLVFEQVSLCWFLSFDQIHLWISYVSFNILFFDKLLRVIIHGYCNWQSRFLLSGSCGEGQWIVPITLCCGSYDVRKNFLLQTKTESVDIKEFLGCSFRKWDGGNDKSCDWIKLNVDQTGFYRVKYDTDLSYKLRNAIEKDHLTATDRFGN